MRIRYIIDRLGLSGIVFILGLIISSFVLINTIDTASKIAKEDKSNNMYSESIRYSLSYNGVGDKYDKDEYYDVAKKIIDCLENLDCNVSIFNVGVRVNNQIQDMFPEIVVNMQDDYRLELNSGRVYASDLMGYQLVIGESVIGLTDEHDGTVLDVGNMKIPVQGILKNNNAASIDYSIVLLYNECDQELKHYLTDCICNDLGLITEVKLYGDDDISETSSMFVSEMNKLSVECEEFEPRYEGNDYQNYWYRFYNRIFLTICLVFSIFTCFSLSYLWVSSRKKELAIRKAFGYNNNKIFILLVRDILSMIVPAIMISMVLEVFYCLVFDNFSFFDKYFVMKFIAVLLGAFIVGVLCAVNIMKEVSKITPVSAIRKE